MVELLGGCVHPVHKAQFEKVPMHCNSNPIWPWRQRQRRLCRGDFPYLKKRIIRQTRIFYPSFFVYSGWGGTYMFCTMCGRLNPRNIQTKLPCSYKTLYGWFKLVETCKKSVGIGANPVLTFRHGDLFLPLDLESLPCGLWAKPWFP